MLLLYHLQDIKERYADYIYIPLCFYFIEDEGIETGFVDEFTFHYASTLSLPKGTLDRIKS